MQISSSYSAFCLLKPDIDPLVEEFWGLSLSTDKTVLASKKLFKGTLDFCPVHSRDIFRFACITNSHTLIVAHSHPSHNLTPSEKDMQTTRTLVRAGKLLQIPLIDHLIISTKGYRSFADEGWFLF